MSAIKKIGKPLGFRRNLDYIKENFILVWKVLIEFKSNLYSSLFLQFFYYFNKYLFFYVLFSSVGDIIGWELIDYLILILIIDLLYSFIEFFNSNGNFSDYLLSGDLNLVTSKPQGIFFKFFFGNLRSSAILFLITSFIALIILFFQINFSLGNLILSIFIFILLVLLHLSISFFISSLAFLSKNLDSQFSNIYWTISNEVSNYPSQFFKNLKFRFIFYIFSGFFVSSLLIPLLRGYDFFINPFYQLGIILSLIVFFSLITFLNWHFGLKKYEAFG